MGTKQFLNVPRSVTNSMKGNKSSGTKPELIFSKTLWSENIRGYRRNYKKVKGTPDIYFPKHKVVVFINGCFWHRCPYCKPHVPKKNSDYWNEKFEKNVSRDKRNKILLRKSGYKVIVIWECQINKSLQKQVLKVKRKVFEE